MRSEKIANCPTCFLRTAYYKCLNIQGPSKVVFLFPWSHPSKRPGSASNMSPDSARRPGSRTARRPGDSWSPSTCPECTVEQREAGARRVGRATEEDMGMGQNSAARAGDRRFESRFPFARVPCWIPIFDPKPHNSITRHPLEVVES